MDSESAPCRQRLEVFADRSRAGARDAQIHSDAGYTWLFHGAAAESGPMAARPGEPSNKAFVLMRQFSSGLDMQEGVARILRFALVGITSGLLYTAIFLALTERFGVPAFISSVCAFSFGIPISYFGNRNLTYKSTNVMTSEMGRFMTVQVLNLILTSVVVHSVATLFPSRLSISVLTAFVVAPIISFVMFEIWVYRPRRKHH